MFNKIIRFTIFVTLGFPFQAFARTKDVPIHTLKGTHIGKIEIEVKDLKLDLIVSVGALPAFIKAEPLSIVLFKNSKGCSTGRLPEASTADEIILGNFQGSPINTVTEKFSIPFDEKDPRKLRGIDILFFKKVGEPPAYCSRFRDISL